MSELDPRKKIIAFEVKRGNIGAENDEVYVNNILGLTRMASGETSTPGINEIFFEALSRNLGSHLYDPNLLVELRDQNLLEPLTQNMTTLGAEFILADALTDKETTKKLKTGLMDLLFPDNFSERK